jgi:hypothetical protein
MDSNWGESKSYPYGHPRLDSNQIVICEKKTNLKKIQTIKMAIEI